MGAAFNALMEEETKRSLAQIVCDGLDREIALRSALRTGYELSLYTTKIHSSDRENSADYLEGLHDMAEKFELLVRSVLQETHSEIMRRLVFKR